jgi:hypothetical protein
MTHFLKLACVPLAALAVATLTSVALGRQASVATMTNTGIFPSQFCTSTGNITIVQSIQADANGQAAIGATFLSGQSGQGTYRLGNGNAVVGKGCYSHTLVSTTVMGNALARSTVWYE